MKKKKWVELQHHLKIEVDGGDTHPIVARLSYPRNPKNTKKRKFERSHIIPEEKQKKRKRKRKTKILFGEPTRFFLPHKKFGIER